jgi:hypothetical protein
MDKTKIFVCIIFISTLIMTIGTAAQASDGLVLWNRLDNLDSVLGSDVGPSFHIRQNGGDVLFVDGVFDGALATSGGTADLGPAGGYLSMSPDEFFPADKTRGTVEFWIQKRLDRLIPYESPLVTFFGRQAYATGYLSISAGWTDVSPNTTVFSVNTEVGRHRVVDNGWEAIPVGQWVHLAFVWDGSGIEGGADDLQLYRDGELVDSHQGRFTEIVPGCCVGYNCGESYCTEEGYEVRIMANHEGRRLSNCSQYPSGYCPAAYMDNIRVWEHAVTDFSDRIKYRREQVSGSVSGIILKTAKCLNKTTGKYIEFSLDGKHSWNCEAEGLQVAPGDRIKLTVDGMVPRDGDLNLDGCIDRIDADILDEYIRNSGAFIADYDLNDDGAVNTADKRTLISLYNKPDGVPCQWSQKD